MAHVNDVLSDRTVHKCTRLREAKCGTTVCQFCAVGCSQLAFYKDKELIEVEGDPRSPIERRVRSTAHQVRANGKRRASIGCSIP